MHSATLLLLDTDPSAAHDLSARLEGNGYRTLLAPTGDRAISIVSENPIGLAIIAIDRDNASERMETVRRLRLLHDIPSLLLTPRHSEPELELLNAGNHQGILLRDSSDIVLVASIEAAMRTAREHEADKLRQEKAEQYRFMAENISDVIFTMDLSLRYTYVSPSVERLTGFTVEEVMAQTIEESLTPDSCSRVRRLFQEEFHRHANGSMPAENWLSVELERITKDGSVKWIEIRATILRDARGKPTAIVGVTSDIDRRKRAELLLKESEERYRLLAENMHDVIWTTDLSGNFTYVSPSVLLLRGYTPEEVMAQPLEAAICEGSRPTVREGFKVALREIETGMKEPARFLEIEQPCKDGSSVWTEAAAIVRYNEAGEPVGLLGVSRNISERKQAEQKITGLLGEKEMLLHEVHHRVKNNMAMIASLLSVQAGNVAERKASEALLTARGRVMSMMRIYERLYRSTDLRHINVRYTLGSLVSDINATYNISPDLITVSSSLPDCQINIRIAVPLGIIVNELITNALKHAFPPGTTGRIDVTGEVDGPWLTITIHDTGIGLPSGAETASGPSFGLRLVRTLAEQVKGSLSLKRGEGTTWVVRVPAEP